MDKKAGVCNKSRGTWIAACRASWKSLRFVQNVAGVIDDLRGSSKTSFKPKDKGVARWERPV